MKEISKYFNDSWLQPHKASGDSSEADEFASGSDHADNLAIILQNHGIDTKVDKRLRDVRISEWLLSL